MGRHILAGLAALALAGSAHAAAGSWPTHPVTIVVPYAPGGATDAVARLVGQRMAEKLGQPFIVENKPGGSSNIGMQAVARAAADGYTLLLVANSIATNNSLFADLPFDGQRDFAPVGMIASAPLVVAVPAASPFKTLGDLLARARAKPGELTYASPGIGSSAHLAGESLKQAAGIEVLHVPYKGAAPALSDMLGGRISFMPLNTVESMSHIKGGKLRALAIARASRMDLLPDVPTAAEAGVPGYEESVWYGLAAPASTPPAVLDRLNAVLREVVDEAAVKQRLVDLGATPSPGTRQQFADFIARERARVAKVVKTANIQAE
ncbi:MAG: LacI family transcriptional regulator [Bordetella sp. SCN 67-23]|nr:tripartite tricarboxylate transporter substrate binding protein [Burkholderiales bacterium]ODS69631.1 MAG: LacI family transcriptional regulator [Bordetella sp. SCN 67-23]ODU94549.1 MAG: LacI family transcriptional regulator [Bordetella sp. SCN 68-11]OJW86241.1 MAG: LacI family transcriptional regulator [Burkholderiales bacterium 67-32]